MMKNNDYEFKFEDINALIPYATSMNKYLRKFRTVCYSKHSRENINFSCFFAFIKHCIEESFPKANQINQLKYSLGKCLNQNQNYFMMESLYDNQFNKESFKSCDSQLSTFINHMENKLGANEIESHSEFYFKNLLTLFQDNVEIAKVQNHIGYNSFYVW